MPAAGPQQTRRRQRARKPRRPLKSALNAQSYVSQGAAVEKVATRKNARARTRRLRAPGRSYVSTGKAVEKRATQLGRQTQRVQRGRGRQVNVGKAVLDFATPTVRHGKSKPGRRRGTQLDAATLTLPTVGGSLIRPGLGIAEATKRNPGGVAKGTARGLKDAITGAPAAGLKFGLDTLEGLKHGDPSLGVRRAAKDYGKDVGRRYGGLNKPGGVERYSKRIEKEGIAAELFDAASVGIPIARVGDEALGAAARSGRLGARAQRTVTEARPRLRTTGGKALEQDVASGLVKATRQKRRDANARATVEKRLRTGDSKEKIRRSRDEQGPALSRQDAVLREAHAQGDVVPTRRGGRAVSNRKLKKAQRVDVAKRGSRTLQQQRAVSRQEVALGANKVISGLSKKEFRGFKEALQGGATTRGAFVAHVRTRLEAIERRRAAGDVDVIDTDEVPALQAILKDPDAHFSPKVAAAVRSERERGARVAGEDARLGRTRQERTQNALLRSLAPQFKTLGVRRRGTPIDAAVRAADEAVHGKKRAHRAAGRRAATETRRAAREEGRTRLLSEQADAGTHRRALKAAKAEAIHQRAAENWERRASTARTDHTRADYVARARAARERQAASAAEKKRLIGADRPTPDRGAFDRFVKAGPLASGRALADAVAAGALGEAPRIARKREGGELGRKPQAALSRLERAKGRQLEAERAHRRAGQEVRAAGASARAVRAEGKRGVELIDPEPIHDFIERGRAVARTQEHPLEDAGFFPSRRRETVRRSLFAKGGSRAVKPDRRYTGKLFEEGREDASKTTFLQGIQGNIKGRFNWPLVADTFDAHTFEWGRNKTITQLEDEMARRGIDPDSVGFWNPERFRATASSVAEAGRAESGDVGDADLHAALQGSTLDADALAAAKDDAATYATTNGKWSVVPKEVLDELQAETKPSGVLGRGFDVFKGKQARVLLATSPAWMQFQIVANGAQSLLAGAGPAEWAKAHRWYHSLSPEEQRAVDSNVGIGAFQDSATQVKLGASTNNRFVNAWRGMKAHDFWHSSRKPLGGASVSQLNPLDALFRIDNAQNNFFRRAVFYNAVKRDAYKRMGQDVGRLQATQDRLMRYLTLGPEEQMKALVKNQADLERNAEHVRDFLGDYLTYTAKERRILGRSIMFYGYLRFSLRFAFYTMPIKHPVRTAIIGQLGRMQAEEVRKLLGGDELPFAMGRFFYERNGKLKSVDLARANPFLNTVTEINLAKGARGPLLSALRFAPPLVVNAVDAAYAKTSFRDRALRVNSESQPRPSAQSGQKDYTAAQLARFYAAGALRLAAPYRALEKARAGGRPISDDSILLAHERYTRYKDPEITAGITQQRRRLPKGFAKRLGLEFAPFVPRDDFSPEIAGKRRQAQGKAEKAKPLTGAAKRERDALLREARAAGGGGGISARERDMLLREARLASGG